MPVGTAGSVEGLKGFDELGRLRSHTPETRLPSLPASIVRILRQFLIEEREGVPAARRTVVVEDQLPNQIVERGSKVLDEVARDQTSFRQWVPLDPDAQEISRGRLVDLGDKPIWLRFRIVDLPDRGV
ncbi:MAG TPA: hypothetical protein VMF55_11220 [Solirubrobacterales bacterium]|nr:hypothetical protein [Solirubrobacterales bacterium]